MKASMKSGIVLIMLLTVVMGGAFYYAGWRHEAQNKDMDRVVSSLGGLDSILPKGRRLTFVCPDNNASLYCMCRYVLAPRYLSFKEEKKYDTALIIARVTATADELKLMVGDRSILWQHTDSMYRYYLTCKL